MESSKKVICDKCKLGLLAKRIVKNRGVTCSKILIVVDNPSDVDESLDSMMCGQEGKLLDQLFEEAFQILDITPLSYFITAAVRCRPVDFLRGPTREPSYDEILGCMKRLMGTILKVNPKYVFLVGKVTDKYYRKEFPDAHVLQPIRFLLKQGGKASPWYRTNLRIILEGLK